MAKKANKRLDKRVHLHFIHYRHRVTDPGGISEKACIDGIVKAGLLKDDSAKYIDEPTHEQKKVPFREPEITIIEITAMEKETVGL